MKKTLILLAAIALLLVLFITVNFMKTMDEDVNIEQTKPESAPSEEAWDPDAAPEQVARVEGATTAIPVDRSSSEQEVMDTMHFMTHQKVMAEKKPVLSR